MDCTDKLQAALDRRGLVCVTEPGEYVISRALKIYSGTHLLACPGATFIAAPRSRCSLLENAGFASGDRDDDITVEGGTWHGNCDEMGIDPYEIVDHRLDFPYDPTRFTGKLLRFAHVSHLALKNLTVRDPVSYGIQIADASGFVARDIELRYNCHFGTTDGVHVNGPAEDGVIENLWGVTNDDMVSLTPDDESHAQVSRGDIRRVEIRNIRADNGYSGVRLLSSGHALTDVHISGVYGTYRHNAVLFSHHRLYPGEPIWMDGIDVERVRASKSAKPLGEDCFVKWEKNAIERAPLIWFEKGMRMGGVSISGVYRKEESPFTSAPLLQIDRDVRIERLALRDLWQTLPENARAPLIVNEGEIGRLISDAPMENG